MHERRGIYSYLRCKIHKIYVYTNVIGGHDGDVRDGREIWRSFDHVTLFYISKVIEKKEKNLICIIYVRVY